MVQKRLKIALEFLPTLCDFCILLHCQALYMEVSKQNSTKLCDMLGSELDLQMHLKNLRLYSKKLGSQKLLIL